ncbi:uncharacterized protein [Diabrotica undecimpunctata]|uniref:uncharacterized protein n=1 Tax=Diabrotica undecimpunctata TaxID=50387 RepID=UPI003B63827E
MSLKQRTKMKRYTTFIHWKSLIAFGLLFWFLLCTTDILGGNSRGYLYNVEDYDLLYETLFMERLEKTNDVIIKLKNFGGLLVLWNLITFVCSIILCQLVKFGWWLVFNAKFKKNFWSNLRLDTCVSSTRSISSTSSLHSKIPIKIKALPLTTLQRLDLKKRLALKCDNSCPNFLSERTCSSISAITIKSSPKCNTLCKNSLMCIPTKEDPYQLLMDTRQVSKLRAEIISLQTKFQKEQLELSRKIDIINKEKKELVRQLTMIQKENRVAKQQIEELVQEKSMLFKKLESATKDIKSNTKSKKAALTKLEEMSVGYEKLKQELEQVTRDKAILENKLKVLQGEYEKLQERIILPAEFNFCEDYHVNMPERDTNNGNAQSIEMKGKCDKIDVQQNNQRTEQPLSQAELDMKNIQVKIKQLEKNLENFNNQKSDYTLQGGDQGGSELNLNITESKVILDDDMEAYDYFFPYMTPRLRYCSGRAGDVVSFRPPFLPVDVNSQVSVIQTIANKVNEKVRLIDNLRDKGESEADEYSSQESLSDIRIPRKIVSSSVAFQKFLKNLQPESARLSYESQSEYCF